MLSGLSESGVSDLYRVHLARWHPRAAHRRPLPGPRSHARPDGRRIVFASDRAADGLQGAANLYLLNLDSARIVPLTAGDWKDESPAWAPDGRIYFTSDRDGVLNVFSVDTLGEGRRETSSWSGAFDGVPLPDGSGLLVGGFPRPELEPVPLPGGFHGAEGPVRPASRGDTVASWTWIAAGDTAGSVIASREPYRSPPHARLRRRRAR